MSFIDDLHGTVSALFIVALLFIDECGVPLPFAPNEALLIVSGLLISTGALNPFLFVPLAYAALVGGMLTGYAWAHAVGSDRLRALAERVRAGKAYDRATGRIRDATPWQMGVTRNIPGVRVYATLVAGAAEVPLRKFLSGALPALAVWEGVMVGLGALVGLPAEHFLTRFQRLAITGVVLVLAVGLSYMAIRRIPSSGRGDVLKQAPQVQRLVLALVIDFGIVATLVAGLDRIIRSIVQTTRFAGLSGLAILVSLTVITYVVVTRRGAGGTAGEGLFNVSYTATVHR